ncbi:hypothetical protein GCM10027217_24250 [Pseudomaricurvus hydrocarbonicus]
MPPNAKEQRHKPLHLDHHGPDVLCEVIPFSPMGFNSGFNSHGEKTPSGNTAIAPCSFLQR